MSDAARREAAVEQYLREQRPVTPRPVPPGWYPHPSMANTQAYWDGQRWTDHIAPGAPTSRPGLPSAEAASTAKLETWGWLGAFFFPIVGIVIGIMLVSRPSKNQGGWILCVSVGWIVLAWVAISASQPTGY